MYKKFQPELSQAERAMRAFVRLFFASSELPCDKLLPFLSPMNLFTLLLPLYDLFLEPKWLSR